MTRQATTMLPPPGELVDSGLPLPEFAPEEDSGSWRSLVQMIVPTWKPPPIEIPPEPIET